MTTNTQADLAAIGKLLDERTVECPGDGVAGRGGSVEHNLCHCTRCDDTGRIPDPQYDALREVIRGDYIDAAALQAVREGLERERVTP